MELDRDFIERTDFAQVRRGYDPDEVGRHLTEVSGEAEDLRRTVAELRRTVEELRRESEELRRTVEELRRNEAPEPPSLSGAAAEQVRVILEAAERSAVTIESQAREDAERRGREAEAHARELTHATESRVESLISRVDDVADLLVRRVDTIEAELSTLREGAGSLASALEGLGDRTDPLRTEIESMRAGVHELRDGREMAPTSGAPAPGAGAGAVRGHEPEAVLAGGPDLAAMPEPPPEPDLAAVPEPATEPRLAARRYPAPEPVLEPESTPGAEPAAPSLQGAPSGGGLDRPEPRGAEEEIVPEVTLEPAVLPEDDHDRELRAAEEEAELVDAEVVHEDEDEAISGTVEASDEEKEEEEGARLVALNMALSGVPRDEADRYLADNFDLTDRSTVLDDVYARVGEA